MTMSSGQAMETAPPAMTGVRGHLARSVSSATGRKILINLIAWILLSLALALLNDRFLTSENLTNVLRQIAAVATVGTAVNLLMIAGGLDLSIGGVVALSGCTAAILSNQLPLPVAFALATGLGALVGLLNGFLVEVVGINSVI
ncbi:MAG: ABC transporter permease, partial [Chloroflexia bacterium]|nr:ABC transporter permease [Chloroflexia bacterium]